MRKLEEEVEIKIRPRPSEVVSVKIPSDTRAALGKVAASRDMSEQALIRFYIGQGLRQDLAKLFSDHVLETTAEVLSRHLQSEEQVSAIIEEIKVEAVS